MLQNSTRDLLTTINNNNSSDAEVNNALRTFFDLIPKSDESEKESVLHALCAALESSNGKYINVLATVIGALFEKDSVPDSVIPRLIKYFENLLAESEKITKSFASKIAPLMDLEGEDDEPDIYELFEEHYDKFTTQTPETGVAWGKFEETWCCGIALFSVSKKAREQARYLRPIAFQNSEFSNGAHWFNTMLSVLDDEPFIAIDIEKKLGVRGKMSGVVDNFQLHTLLMDAFPKGWFTAENLTPEIIQNAKGFGEQCTDLTVVGRWNMFNWTVFRPEYTLDDYSNTKLSDYWIWHEGKPEDIEIFESHRLILLAKCSYQRTWGAQRMFCALNAELKVEQKLTSAEVNHLLYRLSIAPKPANQSV